MIGPTEEHPLADQRKDCPNGALVGCDRILVEAKQKAMAEGSVSSGAKNIQITLQNMAINGGNWAMWGRPSLARTHQQVVASSSIIITCGVIGRSSYAAIAGAVVVLLLTYFTSKGDKKEESTKRQEWDIELKLEGKEKEESVKLAIQEKKRASALKRWSKLKVYVQQKRRNNVFLMAPELKSSPSDIKHPKTEEERDLILSALKKNLVFAHLQESDVHTLVDYMEPMTASSDESVVVKGELGEYFFVVKKGELESNDGEGTETFSRGDSFCEMALLYSTPQTATVRAKTNTEGWKLHRNTYRNVLAQKYDKSSSEISQMLKKAAVLQDLRQEQLMRLADVAVEVSYKAGQIILKKGETGTIFYAIMSGSVRVTDLDNDLPDVTLGPGEYFGERALITKETRVATVKANSAVKLIALSSEDTEEIMGKMKDVFLRNHQLRMLSAMPMFADFTNEMLTSLIASAKHRCFSEGEHIIHQGEVGRTFYLIESGKCDVVYNDKEGNSKVIFNLGNLGCFGEMALVRNVPRGADVIATSECKVLEIGRELFTRVFGKSSSFSKQLHAMSEERSNSLRIQQSPPDEITMNQLKTIAVLGQGAFGRVTLVQDEKNDLCYALKAMSIQFIEKHKQEANILGEKNAMKQCDHPFILKLHKTFKNSHRVFFLLEYCNGGELYNVLYGKSNNAHGLPESQAKFYAACELLALEHLALKLMAYRDMKPENTLIDVDGYCKMIDMGFAKVIKGKSYTFCGTPDYLAPEVILGTGHNRSVDYWSFGVLLYEMVVGQCPFTDNRNDGIFRKIVKGKIWYPAKINGVLKSLIQKLLIADPSKRLGMLAGGVSDITEHEWFADININELIQKKVEAPWKPEIKDETDTSNFKEMEDENESIDVNYVSDEFWLDEF